MLMATKMTVLLLILLLALCAGAAAAEIALARRRSWWPGVILPGLTFLGAIGSVCAAAAAGADLTGEALVAQLIMTSFWANVPTLLLLAIYGVCRRRLRRSRELDQMKRQDLE